MPAFGSASRAQLETCHPDLQKVLNEAIKFTDFVVVEGYRGKDAQNKAYAKGLSKLPYPKGNHNAVPSRAADIAPYPVNWAEGEKPHLRFAFLQGVVYACGKRLGVPLRFGMDWNANGIVDESFVDLPHVELAEL